MQYDLQKLERMTLDEVREIAVNMGLSPKRSQSLREISYAILDAQADKRAAITQAKEDERIAAGLPTKRERARGVRRAATKINTSNLKGEQVLATVGTEKEQMAEMQEQLKANNHKPNKTVINVKGGKVHPQPILEGKVEEKAYPQPLPEGKGEEVEEGEAYPQPLHEEKAEAILHPEGKGEESGEVKVEEVKEKKSHIGRNICIAILLCLLIAGGVGYYLFPQYIAKCVDWAKALIPTAETTCVVTDTISSIQEVVVTDTIAEEIIPNADTCTIEVPIYEELITIEPMHKNSRLAWMAMRYYGAKIYWPYLYDANKDCINNPNDIEVGTPIRVPRLTEAQLDTTLQSTINTLQYLREQAIEAAHRN